MLDPEISEDVLEVGNPERVFRVWICLRRLGHYPEDLDKVIFKITLSISASRFPIISPHGQKLSNLSLSLPSSEPKMEVGQGYAGSSSIDGETLCTSCTASIKKSVSLLTWA